MDEQKKSIDESWKDAVSKEKENLKKPGAFIPDKPDFSFFVTTLALQASISLGAMPNPSTNKTEEDLTQARFMIDTMDMLRDKTKGNLTPEESKLLENVLAELKMQYVSAVNKK
jgi:uncharacterized protein YjaG (DUF416 family)